jgi:hypothetical protein
MLLQKKLNLLLKSNKFFWALIGIASITRIFLIYELPLWGDEAFSAWAISQPILKILFNITDPVHPPGYYLLLKLWGLISNHLFWLRLFSFFAFLLNIFLLKKLFSKKIDFQKIIIFLYAFSGYFLIFDWQVRMYTPALSLILLSLILHKKQKPFLVFFINIVGLFFDYAFLWYILSYGITSVLLELFLNKKITKTTKASLSSIGVFLIWISTNTSLINSGQNGIGWAKPYLDPLFHVPYFLGMHLFPVLAIVFGIVMLFGIKPFIDEKNQEEWEEKLLLSSSFLYTTTLLPSVLGIFLIFHIRSLQIIPFFFIFLIAKTLNFLRKKHFKIFIILILLYGLNFYWSTRVHLTDDKNFRSGKLIVHFYPWKNTFSEFFASENYDEKYMLIRDSSERSSDYFLFWSFIYTASGKETLGAKKIETKIDDYKNDLNGCEKISIRTKWESFLCPNNP